MEISGDTYYDKQLTQYHRFPFTDAINISTLTALVDYIKGTPEELRESMILHVDSPTTVRLYSGLIDERNREYLFQAEAIINQFSFNSACDQEWLLVELQANFLDTEENNAGQ